MSRSLENCPVSKKKIWVLSKRRSKRGRFGVIFCLIFCVYYVPLYLHVCWAILLHLFRISSGVRAVADGKTLQCFRRPIWDNPGPKNAFSSLR
jgi:hypothetical protein